MSVLAGGARGGRGCPRRSVAGTAASHFRQSFSVSTALAAQRIGSTVVSVLGDSIAHTLGLVKHVSEMEQSYSSLFVRRILLLQRAPSNLDFRSPSLLDLKWGNPSQKHIQSDSSHGKTGPTGSFRHVLCRPAFVELSVDKEWGS